MARTTISIVALVGIFGCLSSILPAQESSRRTAKNRPDAPAISGVRPNLSPPTAVDSEFPTANAARNPAGAAQEQLAPPPTTPPSAFSGGAFPAADQTNASDLSPPAELEDNRLRSVLN